MAKLNITEERKEELIDYLNACLRESEEARKDRIERNKINVAAYNSEYPDFIAEGKSDSQAQEFIPKTFVAVERLSKFIIKAITDAAGEFFTVETNKVDIDPEVARSLLSAYLERIGPNGESFLNVIERSIKNGLLKGEMIAKVTGQLEPTVVVFPEGTREVSVAKLTVSPIDPKDYFPDPRGRGLFEIQKTENDLHCIIEAAENGIYDKSAVEEIASNRKGEYRAPVELLECYGTFLGREGKVILRNGVTVSTRDGKILRLEENPFWHGESPFVYQRITVPVDDGCIAAIMDGPVSINFTMNELANLIIDASVRASIGASAVRLGLLEDPNDALGGIQPGDILRLRTDAPLGASVVENVPLGQVNPISIQMYGILESIFIDSSVLTDIAIGRAPPKEATATEIVQLTQSQSVLLAGFILTVEKFISEILRKLWLVLMQNLEFLKMDDIVSAIGQEEALKLVQMLPEERYNRYSGIGFMVKGISELLKRHSDIIKYTQFMSTFLSSPVLAQVFLTRVDMYKYMAKMAQLYGIDASAVFMSQEDQIAVEQGMATMMLGGRGGDAKDEGGAADNEETNNTRLKSNVLS